MRSEHYYTRMHTAYTQSLADQSLTCADIVTLMMIYHYHYTVTRRFAAGSKEDRRAMWGEAPIDVTEVYEVFASYIEGKVSYHSIAYYNALINVLSTTRILLVLVYCTYWCYAVASNAMLLLSLVMLQLHILVCISLQEQSISCWSMVTRQHFLLCACVHTACASCLLTIHVHRYIVHSITSTATLYAHHITTDT
jgi:hypothetical protein